jgi:hypothetical protein
MELDRSGNRLTFLDWLRGVGGIVMLQGHAFHSFLKPDLRGGAAYMFSQFFGGMPPAIFLFLTGVTLAFLMYSFERKGVSRSSRITGTLRRAGYLFGIAMLLRLQLWLFSWPSPWTNLLKVDILNCMGFGIALMSAMALFTTAQRVRICAALGLLIAGLSPLVSQMDWAGAPWIVKAYIAPDYNSFSFFPWAAYLAFGMSAGSLIRLLKHEQYDRAMQWAALLGVAMILAARYFANLPFSIYPKSEFWLDSPAQVLIKLGAILAILAVAYVWTQYGAGVPSGPGWSWVRQFGTTSLLVYWVHIELVYGRWLPWCKNNLDVGQTVLAAAVLIALMLLLATAKTYRKDIAAYVAGWRWSWSGPKPDRVPAD